MLEIAMKIGTKSVLFGAHQFALHPWFVAWAWWRLYGFPWDPRLWVAFFVHDLGYIGQPNMDGAEGEQHPVFGAWVMHWLFDSWFCHDDGWRHFCLYHSRYLAKRDGARFSRLCVADKLAISLFPAWLYLPLARCTGELAEYMEGAGRTPAKERSAVEWYRAGQGYCAQWVEEHKDGREDTWIGTARDEARDVGCNLNHTTRGS